MLGRIAKILYGSERADFVSSCSLDESVARLDAARGSALAALNKESATGTVSAARVVLKRVVPFVGNSFKPYFVGQFEQRGDQVVLSGRFTMHWTVKLFMTFWLGFCALWTLLVVPGVLRQPEQWFMPFVGIGMFTLGLGFVRMCQWIARGDAAWLSDFIQRALAQDGKI